MAEQNTEQTVMVRQVTDVHSNWSYQGELEHGKFSFQLILDDGAQEVLVMPTAEDGKLLRKLSFRLAGFSENELPLLQVLGN